MGWNDRMLKIESIAENVKKHLERRIFNGELCPGERIKEQEISSELGVSRPPIREALKALEVEGLITRAPNKGAFVSTITEKDAWEIYTLKIALYDLATQLGFERITDRDIRKWEQVVEKMEQCREMNPPDVMRYQELNKRFHDIMFELAGHEKLRKFTKVLHNQIKRYSSLSLTAKDQHLKESTDYHKAILEALRKRDMELTTRLTRGHIHSGLKIVQQQIALQDLKSEGVAAA